ncbi:hypothetical protein T459_33071 [Capsicum annuum]|uniref:Pentatricopeptide repeat-containing protein n=1 Tax=Capsicum annuum TaxID=4072 RepID=A0A2G2Y0E8_CAPAN|nr:hypothetical protein T459_33071 [Capsicum annuum]
MKTSALQREGHPIEEEHVVMAQLADVNAWAYGHEQEAAIPIPVQQNPVQEADVHEEGGEEVEKEDIQEAAILIPVQQNPVQEAEADDEEAGEEVEQEEGEQEENVDFQEQENVEEFDNDDDEVEEEDQELAANDDDDEVPHEADNDDDEVPHKLDDLDLQHASLLGGVPPSAVVPQKLILILIFLLCFLTPFCVLFSVLSGYAKNKRFCDVADVFEAMPEKNVVSYNAMLSEYLWIGDFMRHGRMTEACELFDDMPNRNEVSYTIRIFGCVGVSEFEEAWRWFLDMHRRGVIPDQKMSWLFYRWLLDWIM